MLHVAETPRWIEQTNRIYYRRTITGGHEWVLVDDATQARQPAFDHAKLAAAIASATGRKAAPTELPFTTFTFADSEKAIEFTLTPAPGAAAAAVLPGRCVRHLKSTVRCLSCSASARERGSTETPRCFRTPTTSRG